jgi:hypothetical protein
MAKVRLGPRKEVTFLTKFILISVHVGKNCCGAND